MKSERHTSAAKEMKIKQMEQVCANYLYAKEHNQIRTTKVQLPPLPFELVEQNTQQPQK